MTLEVLALLCRPNAYSFGPKTEVLIGARRAPTTVKAHLSVGRRSPVYNLADTQQEP